jgi:hypothetical protein
MNQLKPRETSYHSRIWKNTIRLACWGVAWVAATALMGLGPKFLWNKASVFTLLAAGVNVAVGVGMILANKRYIADLDELQQKVYLNALAITVGVAVIAGIPVSVLNKYDVIPFKADISFMVGLMGLTYMVCVFYGNWRYR